MIPARASRLLGSFHDFNRSDDDGFLWYITMATAVAGFHDLDFIHDLHAFGDLAKYCITPALRAFTAEIQEVVVFDVNKELRTGGVGVGGAGHGDAAIDILEAVIGFVGNGGAGGFLLHILIEATALDHEVIDDAMEDSAIVMAAFGVLHKISHGLGGLGGVQLQGDVAKIGVQDNDNECSGHNKYLMGWVKRVAIIRLLFCPEHPVNSPKSVVSMPSSEKPTHFLRKLIAEDVAAQRHGGKVATRFPPEPNGYLHIGHAKSICLNFGLAEEFGGTCNLRFDDTNPEKEEDEYIRSIKSDVQWLGFQWQEPVHFASDYFDQLYAWAVHLIRDGKAYVCHLSPDEAREYRGSLTQAGKPSPYRDRSVEENLKLFEEMKSGSLPEGICVLRAKIDMASPNINLRDPILYRIRHVHHHQTGDKWKIYPTYDYAHGQSDAIEGITHSICTLEFEDHRPLYEWLIEHLPVPAKPRQYEFARLNLNYTITSKRKLKQLVDEKHVGGWDDPRMPTISGMRRRGYSAAAIKHFCEMIGVARSESVVDVGMLEFAIRDDLDKNARRAMCVLNPLKIIITNFEQGKLENLEAPNHPQREDLGKRVLPFTRELFIDRNDFREVMEKDFKRLVLGQEVRLRNAYVIRADEVIKDAKGEIIELRCSYDPETHGKNPADGRKVKGVIHWVSASHCLDVELRLYDRLFTAENPEADKDKTFLDFINPQSLTVLTSAKAEQSLGEAKAEDRFQFEREGYFCADRFDSQSGKLVFNRTIGLKDSFGK